MQSEPQERSLNELIEIAKRAQSILGHLDLEAIASRIYVEPSDTPEKPLEFVAHQDGLPLFDICLAPDYSPADGAHGIFVSNRGVFSVMVPKPIVENRWRVLRSVPYESEAELIDTVRRYIARPTAREV